MEKKQYLRPKACTYVPHVNAARCGVSKTEGRRKSKERWACRKMTTLASPLGKAGERFCHGAMDPARHRGAAFVQENQVIFWCRHAGGVGSRKKDPTGHGAMCPACFFSFLSHAPRSFPTLAGHETSQPAGAQARAGNEHFFRLRLENTAKLIAGLPSLRCIPQIQP